MKAVALAVLVGCGASPAEAPVVVVTLAPTDGATRDSPRADAGALDAAPSHPSLRMAMVAEATRKGASGPLAFTPDGTAIGVLVDNALELFDSESLLPRNVAPAAPSSRASGPLLVLGDRAFDPNTGREVVLSFPKPWRCRDRSFSYDGARAAAYCESKASEGVLVIDTRSGALVGLFSEFQTAAPIRSGALTPSGNFIFWSSRATGAFEEIQSHLTGPAVSSHTVMSPDERFLFTAPDRAWYTDAEPTGHLLDAKNGHEVRTIAGEVERGVFSPSGHWLAVFHVARTHEATRLRPLTVHALDRDDLAGTMPDPDTLAIAFAPDDHHFAVVTTSRALRLYTLDAP